MPFLLIKDFTALGQVFVQEISCRSEIMAYLFFPSAQKPASHLFLCIGC